MKKIYLILMHTNTIPAKLVKFFTRYEYSHVAISLEKDCNIIYSYGRKKVNSILNGGYTAEKRNGEFFKKFNNTVCKIYEIDVTKKQYQRVKEIINDMQLNTTKYKYDFLGIIPRFFGIPVTIKNRYVCSYFVAYVLKESKIYNFSNNICLIKPRDFESLNILKEKYIGKYSLYK